MAVDYQSWSTTAASNTTINGIDIDESWAAANINNAIRDMMAQFALLRDMENVVTAGTANAQTLTTGFSLSSYQQNFPLVFEAGSTTTSAGATLNVDTIGAKTMIRPDGQDLHIGGLVDGGIYRATYEAGADKIVIWNPSMGISIPVNTQTDDYTLVATDAGKYIRMNKATANTLTIPPNSSVAFPIETVINVRQQGAGTTTVTGDTGVTLNGTSAGSGDLTGQYFAVTLVKTASDTWDMFGGHAAVS